jgi:hypothetical protein
MRSRNNCCRRRKISIAYSECVSVAIVIQHTKLMCRIILPFEPCLAVPVIPHYPINGRIFGVKKVIELKMCILIFSATFVRNFLVLSRNQTDIVINVY